MNKAQTTINNRISTPRSCVNVSMPISYHDILNLSTFFFDLYKFNKIIAKNNIKYKTNISVRSN